jgi:hypothetical protein
VVEQIHEGAHAVAAFGLECPAGQVCVRVCVCVCERVCVCVCVSERERERERVSECVRV